MPDLSVIIEETAFAKLFSFYGNVEKSYPNTFNKEHTDRIISSIIDKLESYKYNFYLKPYLNKWVGLKRIKIDDWNYAIKTEGNTSNTHSTKVLT